MSEPEPPTPVDTRTLSTGDPVTVIETRDGTVGYVDAGTFEVEYADGPETYIHGEGSVQVLLRSAPLPEAFGALVEADVPHPYGGPSPTRLVLVRMAGGEWESIEGWRFSDAYLTNVRVHSHGAPVQAAGLTPAGELVTQ